MGEKTFNTDDMEGGLSLSGHISRRRLRDDRNQTEQNGNRTGTSEDTQFDIPEDGGSDGHETGGVEPNERSANKKRMRITMLGISGSGKTSFLSGVYQTMMVGRFHGLSLISSSGVDRAFQQIGQIADIALINREDYEFASGTQVTTVFPLRLRNRGTTVCDFDFTDYAGGSVAEIADPNGNLSPGAQALKEQLLGSDAILVFADAVALCAKANKADWQQAVGASVIDPLFSELTELMGKKPMTVVFVLTKTDDERIPEKMKANNFAVLIERMTRAFEGTYEDAMCYTEELGWSFGIVPVSAVGEGNSSIRSFEGPDGRTVAQGRVKEGCAPEPYNIEAVMVYTIACILSQWRKEYEGEHKRLSGELKEAARGNTGLGNIFAGLQKRWNKDAGKDIVLPKDKVEALLTEIEAKIRYIDELNEQILDLIDKEGVLRVVQRSRNHIG